MSEIILKRVYAYLIDMVVVSIPMYTLILIFWDGFIASQPKNFLLIVICIQFLPFLLYFFISEYIFSKTVGKHIMKLKLEFSNNRLISVFVRTVCRLIPLDLISFLLLKDKLLHDYLSKTSVVKYTTHSANSPDFVADK